MKEKGEATRWLPKSYAPQYERIQSYLNNRHFLMVDHDDCPFIDASKHYDIEPNIIVYNPGHPEKHQAFWLLADPVFCQASKKASHPYQYLRAIESAYDVRYGTDKHFARCIHRNPLYCFSDTDYRHSKAYKLGELAEVVQLNTAAKRGTKEPLSFNKQGKPSRHLSLFDELRYWAYPQAKHFREYEYEQVYKQFIDKALALNHFKDPLSVADAMSIAKSVCSFTYHVYTPIGIEITQEYRAKQAARGAIGGKKSTGGGRKPLSAETIDRIGLMASLGYSHLEIAELLKISEWSVNKYLTKSR